jgi:hypothetical protein
MRLFPAQYDGMCADGSDCFGEFEAGDMIGYDNNDELCCQACLINQRGQIEDEDEDDVPKKWGDKIEVQE